MNADISNQKIPGHYLDNSCAELPVYKCATQGTMIRITAAGHKIIILQALKKILLHETGFLFTGWA